MSATSAAQAAGGGAKPAPPLIGRWHHGQGYLVSGTIRIAAWDCDTNPPVAFRDEMLDWMCGTLNAAVKEFERTEPDEFAAPDHPSPSREGPSDAEMLTFLLAHCKVVYYPTGSGYPVEHNPFALGYPKDGAFLLGALRAAMKEHQQ